jgi:MSHA biogenesis protein MshJ
MSKFREYEKKLMGLSLRERALVFLVGLSLIVAPCYFSVLDRNFIKSDRLSYEIKNLEDEYRNKQDELLAWQSKVTEDPNEAMRRDIEKIEKDIMLLDAVLNSETANLLEASEMTKVLTNILRTEKNIQILSVKSVKPEVLIKKDDAQLYKHGISMVIRGRYLDIMNYLSSLETLDKNFYWDSLELNVDKYPYSIVTIEIYTLSVNKDFIRG